MNALSRLCVNNIPPPPTLADRMIVALRPAVEIPPEIYERLTEVHNSNRGHVGLKLSKSRLKEIQKLRLDMHFPPQDKISTRMINEFIRQCPYCQISNRLKIPIKTHPFTCASYNPFEVFHLDHIGPLPKDAHGNEYILVIIDAFPRWVELFPTKSTTALETASVIVNHIGRFGSLEVIHTD